MKKKNLMTSEGFIMKLQHITYKHRDLLPQNILLFFIVI